MRGNCGGKIPNGDRLPVLVGDDVDTCTTAGFLLDPDVRLLAGMVPSRAGSGSLAGVPRATLPPRLREALTMADGWLAEYRAKERKP